MPKFQIDIQGKQFEVEAQDSSQLSEIANTIAKQNSITNEPNFGKMRAANFFDKPGINQITRTLKNIPGSAMEMGKNIATAVMNPVDTATGLRDVISGGLGKILPEEVGGVPIFSATPEQTQMAEGTGQFLKERFGGGEEISRTIQTDPVGALLDASTIFSGIGALGGTGKVAKITGTASKIGRATEPIHIAKNIVKVTNKALGLDKVEKLLAQKFISSSKLINKSQAIKIARSEVAGQDPAKWLADRRITGTRKDIINQLDDIGKHSKSTVDLQLASVTDNFKDAPSAKMLKKLADTLKDDVSEKQIVISERVNQLRSKLKSDGLNLSEMNEIKRLADQQSISFTKAGNPGALDLVNLRDELKRSIEVKARLKGLPEIKNLNKDTQVSNAIKRAIEKRAASSADNNIFSLTDFIVGQGGAIGGAVVQGVKGGVIGSVGLVLSKKILSSPYFKTAIANRLMNMSGSDIAKIQAYVLNPQSSKFAKSFVKKLIDESRKETVALNLATQQAGRLERLKEDQIITQVQKSETQPIQ